MNVLALTIFVGAVLVIVFALLWLLQACSAHSFSDRESLLPFEEELPAPTRARILRKTRGNVTALNQ